MDTQHRPCSFLSSTPLLTVLCLIQPPHHPPACPHPCFSQISHLILNVPPRSLANWAGSPAARLCFSSSHGTSPWVCYCRLCRTWAGLYDGLKAFASNENLVLDYRALGSARPVFSSRRRAVEWGWGEWGKRVTGGRVYFSPETVGRKISLVKLRLHLSQANDVTEAGNRSVYLYREGSGWMYGVHRLCVGGLNEL